MAQRSGLPRPRDRVRLDPDAGRHRVHRPRQRRTAGYYRSLVAKPGLTTDAVTGAVGRHRRRSGHAGRPGQGRRSAPPARRSSRARADPGRRGRAAGRSSPPARACSVVSTHGRGRPSPGPRSTSRASTTRRSTAGSSPATSSRRTAAPRASGASTAAPPGSRPTATARPTRRRSTGHFSETAAWTVDDQGRRRHGRRRRHRERRDVQPHLGRHVRRRHRGRRRHVHRQRRGRGRLAERARARARASSSSTRSHPTSRRSPRPRDRRAVVQPERRRRRATRSRLTADAARGRLARRCGSSNGADAIVRKDIVPDRRRGSNAMPWDGRDSDGASSPDGEYTIRLSLARRGGQHRRRQVTRTVRVEHDPRLRDGVARPCSTRRTATGYADDDGARLRARPAGDRHLDDPRTPRAPSSTTLLDAQPLAAGAVHAAPSTA